MKTLEDAIGCWTTNPEYNGLVQIASIVGASARLCRTKTLNNNPQGLLEELELLQKRVNTMEELTNDTIRRCREIINTNELA